MGNRAVIQFRGTNVGIYLHWNGGRDSVEAFLKYCELQGFRNPSVDNYGVARCCQVITNFFPGGLSVGVDTLDRLDTDNGDNGTYVVDNWKIVGRENFKGQEQYNYNLEEMLKSINDEQPESIQLEPSELKI